MTPKTKKIPKLRTRKNLTVYAVIWLGLTLANFHNYTSVPGWAWLDSILSVFAAVVFASNAYGAVAYKSVVEAHAQLVEKQKKVNQNV